MVGAVGGGDRRGTTFVSTEMFAARSGAVRGSASARVPVGDLEQRNRERSGLVGDEVEAEQAPHRRAAVPLADGQVGALGEDLDVVGQQGPDVRVRRVPQVAVADEPTEMLTDSPSAISSA